MTNIAIIGSSLEFASDHLLNELCSLGHNGSITLYDVNLASELGRTGHNLTIQATQIHPGTKINHTSDIGAAVKNDIILFWGLYFPKAKTYNAAYKEFFSGQFKVEVERQFEDDKNYNPTVLFLYNNGSGLKAANFLGRELPNLKSSTFVLAPINHAFETKIYFRIEAAPIKLDDIPAALQEKVDSILEVSGGLLDVDSLVRCIKGLFDGQSPRDMFDYVGTFPTQQDRVKWNIDDSSCIFMPQTDSVDDDKYGIAGILQNEIAAVKDFVK